MQIPDKSNKIKFRSLHIIAVAIFIFILLILLIAEPYTERQIIKALNRNSIKTGHVDVKWILPGISLRDVSYKNVTSSGIIVESQMGMLQIRGIHILKALSGNFYFRKLEVSRGNIYVLKRNIKENPAPYTFERYISVDALVLEDIELTFIDSVSMQVLESTGIKALVNDIRFSDSDTFQLSDISNFVISSDRISVYKTDSLNSVNLYKPSYSTYASMLRIDSLSLMPRYPQYEYTSKFEYQTDRIELLLKSIETRDLLPGDILKGDLVSSGITIDSLSIDAFRDKRKKFKHENKKMLQEIIYSFPGRLSIDSIILNKGFIKYSEREEDSEEAGYIYFSRVSALGLNLSNDSSLKNYDRYMKIHSKGRLMDVSNVDIAYKARIYDPSHSFSMTGSMDDMNLSVLNTIIKKSEMVSLSGRMHSLHFEFAADTVSAAGSLKFLYDSMAIKVEGNGLVKDKLATWIGNFKLLDSNPLPGEAIRTGRINYKRDPERFIFNYSVKSLMTGIESSVARE